MLEWLEPSEAHAIQLVAEGSHFDMFIAFRDSLLAHPSLVAEYNQVKLHAAHLPDTEYREKKSTFIERVIRESKFQ